MNADNMHTIITIIRDVTLPHIKKYHFEAVLNDVSYADISYSFVSFDIQVI